MSDLIRYTTKDGDRWDLLADHFYGNANQLPTLLRANPAVATLPVLPAGLVLVVPIIEQDERLDAIDTSPWSSL